jgi:hypothetical protein
MHKHDAKPSRFAAAFSRLLAPVGAPWRWLTIIGATVALFGYR